MGEPRLFLEEEATFQIFYFLLLQLLMEQDGQGIVLLLCVGGVYLDGDGSIAEGI